MRNRTATTIMAAAFVIAAGAASADDRTTVQRSTTEAPPTAVERQHDAALLEDERQEHVWAAQNEKGMNKLAHRAQEEEVQAMIDALERGERVDPEAIDRQLNRTR
jgi:hypothetical protein